MAFGVNDLPGGCCDAPDEGDLARLDADIGESVNDPGCVAKTYPGFFTDLEKLRC